MDKLLFILVDRLSHRKRIGFVFAELILEVYATTIVLLISDCFSDKRVSNAIFTVDIKSSNEIKKSRKELKC